MEADRPNSDALTQQQLLWKAMDELGLTREQLGMRLCVAIRTLDEWLLPVDDPNARVMPETGKTYVRDILERQRKRL
jgi:hypothetical protein